MLPVPGAAEIVAKASNFEQIRRPIGSYTFKCTLLRLGPSPRRSASYDRGNSRPASYRLRWADGVRSNEYGRPAL